MLLHTALLLHYTFEGGRRQTTEGFAVRDRDRRDENERVRACEDCRRRGRRELLPGRRGRARAGGRLGERRSSRRKASEMLMLCWVGMPEYGELHLCCYASAIQIFLLLVRENP